ncbi:hypothetical protein ACF0H5_018740 [Mactra antiquata]
MYSLVVVSCLLGYAAAFPLHASCKLDWTFQLSCADVMTGLANQINAWNTADNCPNGAGERCLYTLTSQAADKLSLTHETPVKHYVDTITFTFMGSGDSCSVHGYSTANTWYAVLDYGTNYCNMRNLLEGAGFHTSTGFTETTNNNICTQYSSANCDKY